MSADVTAQGPVARWTGWDIRGGASADPRAAVTFAQSATHSPSEERYELMAVAARGFRPPRFLSTIPHSEGSGGADGGAEPEHPGLRQTWSVEYRCIHETGPAAVTPYAIYLLAVNPPPGGTPEELDRFNDFYTGVHLPEVAERRHALRAVRFELVREQRPPYKGAPQFLAVYELHEEASSVRRHVGPPYSKGPEVWQRHTTPWRLWYHRLAAAG